MATYRARTPELGLEAMSAQLQREACEAAPTTLAVAGLWCAGQRRALREARGLLLASEHRLLLPGEDATRARLMLNLDAWQQAYLRGVPAAWFSRSEGTSGAQHLVAGLSYVAAARVARARLQSASEEARSVGAFELASEVGSIAESVEALLGTTWEPSAARLAFLVLESFTGDGAELVQCVQGALAEQEH